MAEQYAHLTPISQLMRIYPSESGFINKEPYLSVVNVVHSSPDEVILTGAKGAMSEATIEAVRKRLIASGVTVANVDRAEGHSFPYGEIEYSKDGVTRYVWELESGFRSARSNQAEKSKGENMKALADSNIGTAVTEIKDKDGNLMIKITREYGVAMPTAEVIQVEAALVELAAKLQNA